METKGSWDENQHLTPLKTKLCVPPPRSNWISRLRLAKRMEIRLLQALIFKAKQDIAAALGDLKLAFSLGEPGGFTIIFVSKGKPVADLLEEIIAIKFKLRP